MLKKGKKRFTFLAFLLAEYKRLVTRLLCGEKQVISHKLVFACGKNGVRVLICENLCNLWLHFSIEDGVLNLYTEFIFFELYYRSSYFELIKRIIKIN
jgi:hypothetical protein